MNTVTFPKTSESPPKRHPKVYFVRMIPWILLHVACLAAFWIDITTLSILMCISLYIIRMWGVTAGYHRYFSHKAYKTSRVFQFFLAFVAQSSLQRGVLQWANDHRRHHTHSDTELDPHSPRLHGFIYSHVEWVYALDVHDNNYSMVEDLKKYPELVWLDKYRHLPGVLLGIATWLIDGWSGLVVGFYISTVLVWHCTFFINSLAHVFGSQRYLTADDSRNNFWLALLTLGEGWHNNHHHYPISVQQGFFWWEIDISYYILKCLSWVGIVWDLKKPPHNIIQKTINLSPRMIVLINRFFTTVGFDLSLIIHKLENLKSAITPNLPQKNEIKENLFLELAIVKNMIEVKMTMLDKLPIKLSEVMKKNLEESIQLLKKLEDWKTQHIHEMSEQFVLTLNAILNHLTLKTSQ